MAKSLGIYPNPTMVINRFLETFDALSLIAFISLSGIVIFFTWFSQQVSLWICGKPPSCNDI
mgnify:CR=1 FL=1